MDVDANTDESYVCRQYALKLEREEGRLGDNQCHSS